MLQSPGMFSFTNGVEPRKISTANLENLFSILMAMVNASSVTYRAELIGVVGLIFNKIQIAHAKHALDTIATLKLTRAWYVSYIRGFRPSMKGFKPVQWNFQGDCPGFLEGVLPVLDGCASKTDFEGMLFFHRVIYCVLSMDRVIVVPVKPDYSSITNKYTGRVVTKGDKSDLISLTEIETALRSMGITPTSFKEVYELRVTDFDYEVLSSAGPNGPSTWTAHSDVRAWAKNPELYKQLRSFLEESKMSFMIEDMYGVAYLPETDLARHRSPILGKLNVVEEWGGKARIVAALDYWTQMAFTPLHDTINHFLRLLPSDGTFAQDEAISRAQVWSGDASKEVNCFDLTAATDRLSLYLQMEILGAAHGSASFATAWERLLRNRDFLSPDGEVRRYAVGQPMGARSSFPMLALTHHVIIRVAALRAKLNNFSDYVIIGDDCAICNNTVAANYQAIMSAYGVSINLTKSILYGATLKPAAELCKRLFVDGFEISTIPGKTLVKTVRDGRLLGQLQNELTKRDPSLESLDFWRLATALVDKETLKLHVKNNCMPVEVTGLVKALVPAEFKLSNPETWFSGVKLTDEDIIQVYTWTVAVEGLKRLDSLLRSSLAIADLIQLKALEDSPSFEGTLLSEIAGEVKDTATAVAPEAAKELRKLPALNSFHPVVRASEAEARRLSDDLFLLASSDSIMVAKARKGLLDRFRNALTDIWVGRKTVNPAQDRALVVKSLHNLETLCRISKNKRLDYTVVLSMIGRMWSVRLELSSVVVINSVKSRISTVVEKTDKDLSSALAEVSFINPSRQIKAVKGNQNGASGDSATVRRDLTALGGQVQ